MQAVVETNSTKQTEPILRCRWQIAGRVQGVGFRPLVYCIARRLHIGGAVWNDSQGVVIEGQGTRRQLDDLLIALRTEAPATALIRQIAEQQIPPHDEPEAFEIRRTSEALAPTAEVAADLAVCSVCLAEIRDSANERRHGYALTNCTHCGPRFSMIRSIPYDRANTTMTGFAMCPACRREYDEPTDRRFHAQPTACRECGPQLQLLDLRGLPIDEDPVQGAARRLFQGQITAIKGIGGFHLAARADDQAAVLRLRGLKHRPAKPFALMCASLDAARRLIRLSESGAALIVSSAAPIVLARRVVNAPVAAAVAPGAHRLGVMLAYTPLHHLIFDELRKSGVYALVMTSGNDVDEPLVFEDGDVVKALGGLCDVILLHNRPIQRAVDDSVIIDADAPLFVRRSRGYVPTPIPLPAACDRSPGLAVGAELKCTVATCRDGQAVLSQHLGNLTQTRTFKAFKRAIGDLCDLFAIAPAWIAHDLHPAYLSTHYAKQLARQWHRPLIGVQHHHAHAAAVLAEHGLTGPALAIVCDGTGYGTDGTIWGGELLVASLGDFRRIGRLAPMLLPGGDVCAKQPWRSALALLHMALGSDFTELQICRRLATGDQLDFLRQVLAGGAGCIQTSSTGRLFDGVAALLGLCHENHFDAQAPMALEAAAAQSGSWASNPDRNYRLRNVDGLIEIDLTLLVRRIVQVVGHDGVAGDLAMLFHQTLAAAWSAAIAQAMQTTELRTVALSGGVFCNQLFTDLLTRRLENLGAQVLWHRVIPPNDGGIAYGQAAVASARVKQTVRRACA